MRGHILLFCLGWLFSAVCYAANLSLPQGKVILTVGGNISQANTGHSARFDRQMLAQLPQHTLTTQTPWTEEAHVYEGVLLRDLLQYLGASGQYVTALALNEYQSDIKMDLIHSYPILLAMKDNGTQMRVRDKGPLWIIFPLSEYPELNIPSHYEKMVWQLNALEVQP